MAALGKAADTPQTGLQMQVLNEQLRRRHIIDSLGDNGTRHGLAILALATHLLDGALGEMLFDAHDFENACQLLELGREWFLQAFFQKRHQGRADRIPNIC